MLVRGASKPVQDWDADEQNKMHEKIRTYNSKTMVKFLLDEGTESAF